ncbi:unnamed protein product [Arctogadus glacialis]
MAPRRMHAQQRGLGLRFSLEQRNEIQPTWLQCGPSLACLCHYQNLQFWFLISLFCDRYKLTLPLWILWAPLVSLTHKGTCLSLVAVTLCLLWWKRANQTIFLNMSFLVAPKTY